MDKRLVEIALKHLQREKEKEAQINRERILYERAKERLFGKKEEKSEN